MTNYYQCSEAMITVHGNFNLGSIIYSLTSDFNIMFRFDAQSMKLQLYLPVDTSDVIREALDRPNLLADITFKVLDANKEVYSFFQFTDLTLMSKCDRCFSFYVGKFSIVFD
jgi:hypothetical protein